MFLTHRLNHTRFSVLGHVGAFGTLV